MTKEEALLLLRNLDDHNLTEQDKAKRDRLVAAVNNLVEFSVCAEYQLYKKSKVKWQSLNDGIDYEDEELMDEFIDMCATYNDTYAAVEHSDVEYAMAIAFTWLGYSDETYLEYMTQNDDRVRPWHYALQGFVERAADFPAWMIPPIEWRCRCFLITLDGSVAVAKKANLNKVMAKAPQKPVHLDGVFDESVAKCGRIFGKAHPYFKVSKNDKDMLSRIVDNIKKDYYELHI